jgi:hypothetical protein
MAAVAETMMTTTLPFPEEGEEIILEDLFSSLEVSEEVAEASEEVLAAADLEASVEAVHLEAVALPEAGKKYKKESTKCIFPFLFGSSTKTVGFNLRRMFFLFGSCSFFLKKKNQKFKTWKHWLKF